MSQLPRVQLPTPKPGLSHLRRQTDVNCGDLGMTLKRIARLIGVLVTSALIATILILLIEVSGVNVLRLAE